MSNFDAIAGCLGVFQDSRNALMFYSATKLMSDWPLLF
jgi:hypothetical protein